MGNRRRDVQILLGKCSCDLPVMQAEYESSLAEKSIPDSLRIKLKSFFENLRSVLDYLAHDISDTHCGGKTKSSRLYFPIVQDRPSFAGQMSRWFPGLEKKAPDLWKYLESIQPYNGSEYEWLGLLNKVNNENKHKALVEQIRTSTQRVNVRTQSGGTVNWSRNNVRFGKGVFIGGVPIDPRTQLPVPSPTQQVTIQEWVDFRFEGIDVSALGLCKASLAGVIRISETLEKWL